MSEIEELRAATREAHEAMKDIRLLMRDARVLMAELNECIGMDVKSTLNTAVAVGMAAHQAAIEEAITEAERLIYERFGAIGDVLLGEDRNSARTGNAIREMAQRWAAEQ